MERFSLPGYDVEQLLGFGGSGEVWRARERATGDLVALKRLRGEQPAGSTASTASAADEAPASRLRREAALLASVRHEHVVRLRSVVPTVAGPVLVLDYAEGGSLAALLRSRGRLSAGEVITVGAPLAQALSDVHGRGLTHGDVTPGNIVFDATGKPLLADLGVARLVGETAAVTGATPGFADPVVVAGGRPTPASDVHGLAAVCYAALAGVAPYMAGRDVAPPLGPLAPSAPSALVVAIESCLDPDPRARPDAAAFARALHASCAPEAVRLLAAVAPVASEPTHEARARPLATQAVDGPAARAGRHRPRRAGQRLLGRRRLRPRGDRRPGPARVVTLSLVALALLAAAVLVGVGWASRERPAAASVEPAPHAANSSTPSPAASSPAASSPAAASSAAASSAAARPPEVRGDQTWAQVMTALDRLRDQAFDDADPATLAGVYVATSPALAADEHTVDELVSAGEHARGLELRLTEVVVMSQTTTSASLKVTDTLPGYDLVRADGVVEHEAGRGERAWIVTLRATATGGPWRIDTIAAG